MTAFKSKFFTAGTIGIDYLTAIALFVAFLVCMVFIAISAYAGELKTIIGNKISKRFAKARIAITHFADKALREIMGTIHEGRNLVRIIMIVSIGDAIIIGCIWGAISNFPNAFTAGYVGHQVIIGIAICAAYDALIWCIISRVRRENLSVFQIMRPRAHHRLDLLATAVAILLVSTVTMVGTKFVVAAI